MPAIFSVNTIIMMLFVIRFESPMFLITSKRWEEARKAIGYMFQTGKDISQDDIFEYLKNNTSRETDKVGFRAALFDNRYRMSTYIAMSLAIIQFANGIYPVSA